MINTEIGKHGIKMVRDEIKGIKLLAIDFGMRRIGIAVCDEFHIVVRPVNTIINDENVKPNLRKIVEEEHVGACVLGLPIRQDDKNDKLIAEIKKFAEMIKAEFSDMKIFFYDEYMTSRKASETMVQIGKKKSKRATKGELDKVAAAIILTDFLAENEG